jgi:hypothetical protein
MLALYIIAGVFVWSVGAGLTGRYFGADRIDMVTVLFIWPLIVAFAIPFRLALFVLRWRR